ARVAVRYERRYPATITTEAEAEQAARIAAEIAGAANVDRAPVPLMGSEDFAYMLQKKPGAYVWLGNGDGAGGCMLHNPRYDFNDAILPIGASFWARLAETTLA
ncbi:MAG: M20/M25/M40 family metallo-hydrolase, partial [Candidatus Eiseniibacteriota bacterium]